MQHHAPAMFEHRADLGLSALGTRGDPGPGGGAVRAMKQWPHFPGHKLGNGKSSSGWWFGTCFIFPYVGNNNPN